MIRETDQVRMYYTGIAVLAGMYNRCMRRYGCLVFWLIGILFPLAGLGRFSAGYRRAFDTLFGPAWMHVVMHLLLFAGLAALLVWVLRPAPSQRSITRLVGVILLAGLLQEGFQALNQGSLYWPGVLFDLGVDLTGGALGLAAGYWFVARLGAELTSRSP